MYQSRKSIIIIALVALLLILSIVLTILQVKNLQDLRESLEEEKIILAEARDTLERRIAYRENAPEYRERVRVLDLMMPETAQEEQILRYFHYLAEEHELNVQQINFGAGVPNEEQGYVSLPLSVTLEGRFINMIDLFAHLYRGSRAVRVDNISITLAPNPNLPANIRASITAIAFHSISE